VALHHHIETTQRSRPCPDGAFKILVVRGKVTAMTPVPAWRIMVKIMARFAR
jgi:hypothetical protein